MSDKRTPHTDALDTLGMIIGTAEKRDAIHLAVEPAVAAHPLKPGDDVGFVDGGIGKCDKPVGIVDPFLKKVVKTGERFWLVVYPRQITSLRHVWEHPDFPSEKPNTDFPAENPHLTQSRQWIEDYARGLGVTGDELIEGAQNYLLWGEWMNGGENFEGQWTSDEFWDHFAIVTGKPVQSRGNFFSCSC